LEAANILDERAVLLRSPNKTTLARHLRHEPS
jgi:hypothetical protein